jgi:hypothetical protein
MRTLIIIVGGFVLLGACIGAARMFGNKSATAMSTAAKIFIALWFVATAINMWIGVAQAGYSFMDELPIFLLNFLLPAGAAFFIQRKFSK